MRTRSTGIAGDEFAGHDAEGSVMGSLGLKRETGAARATKKRAPKSAAARHDEPAPKKARIEPQVARSTGTVVETEQEGKRTGKPTSAASSQPKAKSNIRRPMADRRATAATGTDPFPNHAAPTPEACEKVYARLARLHGEYTMPDRPNKASLDRAGCGDVPSVLDAVLRTIISANLKMEMASRAIRKLVEVFGVLESGVGAGSINWEKIRRAPISELEAALSVAGCHVKKGGYIRAILDQVHEENLARYQAFVKEEKTGDQANLPGAEQETQEAKKMEMAKFEHHYLSLDHCHNMTKEEAMAELTRFKGVGTKTAACVVLFCIRKPAFAVDTHVHRFCQWLGWVPPNADRDKTFYHCDARVPDHLKYGLHQLFIRHGQQCFKCRSNTRPGTKDWMSAPECPLEDLLDRGKVSGKVKVTVADKEKHHKESKISRLPVRKRHSTSAARKATAEDVKENVGGRSSSVSSEEGSAYVP